MFKAILLTLFIYLFSAIAFASGGRTGPGVYLGLGPLYAPASYRVVFGAWELGQLNSSSLGFAKTYYDQNIYSSFGLVVVTQGQYSPGFFGAIGWDRSLALGLYLRAELNAQAAVNASMGGEAQLGMGWRF